MSHIQVTHMNESCHTCHTYERVTSSIWMSHVTHLNESCHTYEWVMSHEWVMSYEYDMSHMWMSHVTHVNRLWHTCEWVMSHKWMSHVTHMNESCHTCEWVMSHMWMSRVTRECFRLKLHAWSTGWRTLIGSPKLQIIFHKRATKYRSLLRKMTYKDKGSYESSPPCTKKTCRAYEWMMLHIWMSHAYIQMYMDVWLYVCRSR